MTIDLLLPYFSKILRRIVKFNVKQYLIKNDILYKKQFGCQKGTFTEHAIIQLIDQINYNFEKSHVTLGISIYLSKAFTVDHQVLLESLRNYGIRRNNIR